MMARLKVWVIGNLEHLHYLIECPKCGHRQMKSGAHCVACGYWFGRWHGN